MTKDYYVPFVPCPEPQHYFDDGDRILITATENDTTVYIMEPGDTVPYTRIIQAGEVLQYPNDELSDFPPYDPGWNLESADDNIGNSYPAMYAGVSMAGGWEDSVEWIPFKPGTHVWSEKDIAVVSIVGIGMRSHSGIASKMFNILSKEKINLQMISTSEIKISAVISTANVKKAVRALHKGFGLDKLKR